MTTGGIYSNHWALKRPGSPSSHFTISKVCRVSICPSVCLHKSVQCLCTHPAVRGRSQQHTIHTAPPNCRHVAPIELDVRHRLSTWTIAPVGQNLICKASSSHSDTPHSAGLLWTSDRPVAETSTRQHTTLTTDRHPCPWPESNPQSQQPNGRTFTS